MGSKTQTITKTVTLDELEVDTQVRAVDLNLEKKEPEVITIYVKEYSRACCTWNYKRSFYSTITDGKLGFEPKGGRKYEIVVE